MLNYSAIVQKAKGYEQSMVKLLRELVAIPGESGTEGPVINRIKREAERLGVFDRIWIDKFGNLLCQVGTGKRLIAVDAHVDTVGIGDRKNWKHDPYKGKVANGWVFGRGAGDQRGATPAMLYAAKITGLHTDRQLTQPLADMEYRLWEAQHEDGGLPHLIHYAPNAALASSTGPTGEATAIAVLAHSALEPVAH